MFRNLCLKFSFKLLDLLVLFLFKPALHCSQIVPSNRTIINGNRILNSIESFFASFIRVSRLFPRRSILMLFNFPSLFIIQFFQNLSSKRKIRSKILKKLSHVKVQWNISCIPFFALVRYETRSIGFNLLSRIKYSTPILFSI